MGVLRDEEHGLEDPESLAGVLQEVMKRLAPTARASSSARHAPAGASAPDAKVLWQQAVGDEVAGWTRVIRYRGGELTVAVANAPLLAELRGFGQQRLVQDLAALGLTGVHTVRFRSGQLVDS